MLAEVLVYGKMLNEAPLAVAVCGETERDGNPMPQWEEDCAASMQNILIAANALGLGTVWLGVRFGDMGREENVKKILEVPEKISVMIRIPIKQISSLSRTATGYTVVRLEDGDTVADVSIAHADDDGEE